MAYEDDPIVIAFARCFREDDGEFVYKTAGTDYTLRVSEDDYFTALSRVRTYAASAKVLGLCISIAGLAVLLMQLMQNRLSFSSIPIFLAGGIARASASALAIWLGLLPFQTRVRAEVSKRRGWKRRGFIGGLRAANIPLGFWLAASAVLATTIWVWTEHDRRTNVLNNGQPAKANVTYSGTMTGRNTHCQLDFVLLLNNAIYPGATTQCSLRDAYRVGAKIPVRYDPSSPEGVIAEGDGKWPALVAIPVLMWPLIGLTLIFGLVPMMLGFAPKRASKQQRDRFSRKRRN